MPEKVTRRGFLGAVATGSAFAVAGCATAPASDSDQTTNGTSVPPGDIKTLQPLATPDDLGDSSRFTEVYRTVRDSVAEVRVRTPTTVGRGSGWVYNDGYLVTNEHVVKDATAVFIRLRTGEWRSATVRATDVYSDLAVLVPAGLPDSAAALPLREQDPPIGEEVLAIGNPFGFTGSVSSGIISGLNRSLPAAGGSQFSIPDAIQTDAPVNPGNSGGPLVDLRGNVVGVINSGGGDNIGFAISGALVSRVVPSLIEDGNYDHSYIGITLRPVTPTIASDLGLEKASGIYVGDATNGGPADGVLQSGDVIRRMGGQPIPTEQALSAFLALQTSPGDTIDIEVIRDGEPTTVTLTLGTRPEPERPA